MNANTAHEIGLDQAAAGMTLAAADRKSVV